MSFSEKVGAYYQSASNCLHIFAERAKDSLTKAAAYISQTAIKVYEAVKPHFDRLKHTTVTFVTENKMSIGLVAIGVGIGAGITALITYLFKDTPQEVPPLTTETPPMLTTDPKPVPPGGVRVLPQEVLAPPLPKVTPGPLKKEGSGDGVIPPVRKEGIAAAIPVAPALVKA